MKRILVISLSILSVFIGGFASPIDNFKSSSIIPQTKAAIVLHNYSVVIKKNEGINLSSIVKSKSILKKTNFNPISNSNGKVITYRKITNKGIDVDGVITGLKKGTTILKFAKKDIQNPKSIKETYYEVKITVE